MKRFCGTQIGEAFAAVDDCEPERHCLTNPEAPFAGQDTARADPYERKSEKKVGLPERQPQGDYKEPEYPFKFVPEHDWTANG